MIIDSLEKEKYLATNENHLFHSLKFEIPLVLNGYSKVRQGKEIYNSSYFSYLSFSDISAQDAYNSFRSEVLNCIGKRYFPIYRMADGEFLFCLNYLNRKSHTGLLGILSAIIKNTKKLIFPHIMYGRKMPKSRIEILQNLLNENYFYVAHGESYSKKEYRAIEQAYIEYLETISQHGILAIHFIKSEKSPDVQFIKPMCDWFDSKNIAVNQYNYVPFYFIYVLLSGKDQNILFKDRNILIITSYNENKKKLVTDHISNAGAKSIQFYPISSNKALLDKINVEKIRGEIKPDIVLVGAGIGSANILDQLKTINTLCIDAGIVLEGYANPLVRDRIFLMDDEELEKGID
jgi:hypothetical protein